jgi:antitoxin HicB
MSNNPYIGSSLDDFLSEERVGAEVNAVALKRVLAWQIEQAMVEKGLSKTEMAKAMKTSRAALNRLLDPLNTSVTLNTIERAARAIGKQLQLELVDAGSES